MAEQTNKSVMAIVREVTEGTPVEPSATTQFIALQEGFSTNPARELLDNGSLTGSIGVSKPIQGKESPTAEVSHYIKHSGVEGQEPQFGLMVEAAFGAKSVSATQYDTVASSTVSVVKVDTGEGATFERGDGLLIKDGTNGFQIRPVLSISSDNLNLGFQLGAGTAPASGVNLGKSVLYKPGESHPTMTVWDYRANGGAVVTIAGSRVTEMSIEASAGELINGSFSMAGVSSYFNFIKLAATDTKLDFLDNATTRVATIATGFYKDPHELADAVASAMNNLGSANTFTCVYDDKTGKFTITSTGATLSLLWNTGVNAVNTIGDKLGFSVAADSTGTLTYTSATAVTLTAPYTPSFDSSDPNVAKDNQVLLGGSNDVDPSCFSVQSLTMNMSNERTEIKSFCATSAVSGSLIKKRIVTVDIVANLSKYDADKFRRFRENTQTSMAFNFGVKSGGNWVAGKCGCLYIPTATITAFTLGDSDGLVTMEISLQAYVDSSLGEVYLSFL